MAGAYVVHRRTATGYFRADILVPFHPPEIKKISRAKKSGSWQTPDRLNRLASLFLDYIQGSIAGTAKGEAGLHEDCVTGELYYPEYDALFRKLKLIWIDADREARLFAWQDENTARHSLNTQRLSPLKGKFSGISRDCFYDNQPIYTTESLGLNPFNFETYAKVKISSNNEILFVPLGKIFNNISVNDRRKARRYGYMSNILANKISEICTQAVNKYLFD
jgi:hypothetical protein